MIFVKIVNSTVCTQNSQQYSVQTDVAQALAKYQSYKVYANFSLCEASFHDTWDLPALNKPHSLAFVERAPMGCNTMSAVVTFKHGKPWS